jgi:hypothetical protein
MPPIQQAYYDILMNRVRNDRYPSHQLLDRIEVALATPDQVAEYVAMLVEKVDETWYPSHQMLDRIQRMLERAAASAAR